MSVTVSKADGVTVLTLTSDPQSPWPPLCQIFKNLCCSPVCCSVSQHLRSLNRASQTVLGYLDLLLLKLLRLSILVGCIGKEIMMDNDVYLLFVLECSERRFQIKCIIIIIIKISFNILAVISWLRLHRARAWNTVGICGATLQWFKWLREHFVPTLQIMIGLLNIGFGLILSSPYIGYLGFPFWLAALFIIFGIMCILSEKYPSPCLVILTVILNLTGVAFAITGITLYGISLVDIGYWRNYDYNCYNGYNGYNDYWYGRETIRPPSLEEKLLQEKCLEGQAVLEMLQRSISAVMIILSVLELCVVISSAVLGIKALRNKEKGQNKSTDDPELYKPLLEEVTAQPVALTA
ncbi:Rho-associated protein kinase 2 [Sarotherodon galilaeus]